jgi:hypothetical protein
MIEPAREPLLPDKIPDKVLDKLPREKEDKDKRAEITTREAFEHKSLDPAGIWSKFLSMRGTQEVTPEQIKSFIQSLEKMMQITVQQGARAAKRAMDRLRESEKD